MTCYTTEDDPSTVSDLSASQISCNSRQRLWIVSSFKPALCVTACSDGSAAGVFEVISRDPMICFTTDDCGNQAVLDACSKATRIGKRDLSCKIRTAKARQELDELKELGYFDLKTAPFGIFDSDVGPMVNTYSTVCGDKNTTGEAIEDLQRQEGVLLQELGCTDSETSLLSTGMTRAPGRTCNIERTADDVVRKEAYKKVKWDSHPGFPFMTWSDASNLRMVSSKQEDILADIEKPE